MASEPSYQTGVVMLSGDRTMMRSVTSPALAICTWTWKVVVVHLSRRCVRVRWPFFLVCYLFLDVDFFLSGVLPPLLARPQWEISQELDLTAQMAEDSGRNHRGHV